MSTPVSIIIILLVVAIPCVAQVENNNIQNRSTLALDAIPTNSSTQEATVEWACVNKKMTQKCLIYHNDQWFTFTPPRDGRFYINLSVEKCRDTRGIQAIVIEGNPCEVSTYRALTCIAQIQHADSYIQLDSMRANIPYLINIDGFLGDFCNFTIQFSMSGHGLSVKATNQKALALVVDKQSSINILKWKLPIDLVDSLESFEINRIIDDRQNVSTLGEVPLVHNTKGNTSLDYAYRDSVSTRVIGYEIIGKLGDSKKTILDKAYIVGGGRQNVSDNQHLKFVVDQKDKNQVQILLVDPARNVVLQETSITYSRALDYDQRIDVGDYIRRGINNFEIHIINKTNHKTEVLRFLSTVQQK